MLELVDGGPHWDFPEFKWQPSDYHEISFHPNLLLLQLAGLRWRDDLNLIVELLFSERDQSIIMEPQRGNILNYNNKKREKNEPIIAI